jgi:hypothetical protein
MENIKSKQVVKGGNTEMIYFRENHPSIDLSADFIKNGNG